VIDRALDVYQREHFSASLDAAYDRLWNDPVARAEELEERALLKGSVADGLAERG